jgi:hypothetical protein
MGKTERLFSPAAVMAGALTLFFIPASARGQSSAVPDAASVRRDEAEVDACGAVTTWLDNLPRAPLAAPAAPFSAACRDSVARNPSSEVARRLSALLSAPAVSQRRAAKAVLCELGPPWATAVMVDALKDELLPRWRSEPRASCLASLADLDQPGATSAVDSFLRDRALIGGPQYAAAGSVQVERSVALAAQRSERLRARAVPLLAAAWRAHAAGFDALREIECRAPVPPGGQAICERSRANQEGAWGEDVTQEHLWRNTAAWALLSGGLAVGGVLTRNQEAGRWFAVTATTLAGAVLLETPFSGDYEDGDPGALSGLGDAGKAVAAIVGGAAGFGIGYLASRNPGSARAATAIAGASVFGVTMILRTWW